jgi:hypothetical protein
MEEIGDMGFCQYLSYLQSPPSPKSLKISSDNKTTTVRLPKSTIHPISKNSLSLIFRRKPLLPLNYGLNSLVDIEDYLEKTGTICCIVLKFPIALFCQVKIA